MNIKTLTLVIASSIASINHATAATDFVFTNLFSQAHNTTSYTVASLDGSVNATLTASKNGNSKKLGALNLDGIGVYTGGANLWGIQNNEVLTVSFSQAVNIGTVHLRQWELADKLTLTTNQGDNIVIDNESALLNTNEYVTVNLSGITSLSLKGETFGTVAFLAGLQNVTTSEVPVPAAAWLFGSALLGLAGFRKKK